MTCAGQRLAEPEREPAEPFNDFPIALDPFLAEHARRYPRMEPADVYKLCHQRCIGPGHLLAEGDALTWIQREVAELAPLPEGVELVEAEVLDRPKGLFRVHRRPWLARGLPLDTLASAFSETAARWTPRPDTLEGTLVRVGELLGSPEVPLGFDRAAWEAFVAPLVQRGLPTVHRSEGYRASYEPAYRVVLVEPISGGA